MRIVDRSEIVDYQTYDDLRADFQKEVFPAKAIRRIRVGQWFNFLFENALTVRYQIQEMMRVEKIVREDAIQHELKTYNGLLGGDGELGCSLLIEIEDVEDRDVKLREWLELPEHLYALLPDGTKVRPTFDEGQRGRDRLSSVQYIKFPVGNDAPMAIGVDLPGIECETTLEEDQRAALLVDLGQ